MQNIHTNISKDKIALVGPGGRGDNTSVLSRSIAAGRTATSSAPRKNRIALVGLGAVGRSVVSSLTNPDMNQDMQLKYVVSRSFENSVYNNIPVVRNINDLIGKNGKPLVDVAIFAGASQDIAKTIPQIHYLNAGISTVDCFDNHAKVPEFIKMFDPIAIKKHQVASVGGGWDPGIFSIIRAMALAIDPTANVYSNYDGFSRGHGTAVRAIPGVADGISKTNFGTKPGYHYREVFVTLAPGADTSTVEQLILKHPDFDNPKTERTVVYFVDQNKLNALKSEQHGGRVILSGNSGIGMEFKLNGPNPLMTANIMIAQAREAYKKRAMAAYGAYNMWQSTMENLINTRAMDDHGLFY